MHTQACTQCSRYNNTVTELSDRRNISVTVINVCGLKTRLKCEEFHVFLQTFDIIVITETKLDSLDDITVPGFRLYTKNRLLKKKSSGGVAALISDTIDISVEELDINQQDTLWLNIKNQIKNKDLILCLAYVPPEKSVYSNISIFTEIEDQLNGLLADNCNLEFCLLGDLNARTGVLSDFIDITNDEQENNNGEECISLD